MKKRIFSLALCLALSLSLLSVTALAERGVSDLEFFQIGLTGCTHDLLEPISSSCHKKIVDIGAYDTELGTFTSGEGWHYDHATHTLTLENFKGTGIYLRGPSPWGKVAGVPTITLKLVGDNVLTGNEKSTKGTMAFYYVDLNITGPGTLTVTGPHNALYTQCKGNWFEQYQPGGTLTITGGAKVTASTTNDERSAIAAQKVIIQPGSTVSATAPKGTVRNGPVFAVDNAYVAGNLVAQCTTVNNGAAVYAGINPYGAGAKELNVGTDVTVLFGDSAATAKETTYDETYDYMDSTWRGVKGAGEGAGSYMSFTQGGSAVAPPPPTENIYIAYMREQAITIDGKAVKFQAYALKDDKGNETNYVKLRDVASALNGTPAQFNVGWNGSVNIETGTAYVPNGTEMITPFTGDRNYVNSTAYTNVDGTTNASLQAIVLTDDKGAGYTYYKLRDLGAALGFAVNWSADKGITVDTSAG